MLVSIHVLRIAWNSSPHWVDHICNQANRNIQMASRLHGTIRSEVCHYAKLANKHKRQYGRQATAEKEREDHELAMRQLHKRIQQQFLPADFHGRVHETDFPLYSAHMSTI